MKLKKQVKYITKWLQDVAKKIPNTLFSYEYDYESECHVVRTSPKVYYSDELDKERTALFEEFEHPYNISVLFHPWDDHSLENLKRNFLFGQEIKTNKNQVMENKKIIEDDYNCCKIEKSQSNFSSALKWENYMRRREQIALQILAHTDTDALLFHAKCKTEESNEIIRDNIKAAITFADMFIEQIDEQNKTDKK